MRTLFRLVVLALAAYGAKTLYDQYGSSLCGQAHRYEPPDAGTTG